MKPMLARVLRQPRRDLAVGEQRDGILGSALPRAEMHLVDRHRRVEALALGALRHPVGVAPVVGRVATIEPVRGGNSVCSAYGSALSTAKPRRREAMWYL